jgi:NTE family protein
MSDRATTLRAFLAEAPFTLAMSSGFFGFFAHAGMLAALESEGIAPSRVAGSSAGALVGACHAAGLGSRELVDVLTSLTREQFWDPSFGAGLLRGDRFRERLETLLPVRTFAECRTELALSTVDIAKRKVRVFTDGPLVPAVYGSCAVPILFQPVRHEGSWLTDGGVLDRPGLAGVPDGARLLYHHLASRSPWRRPGSPSLRIPERVNMRALVLRDLPRVGPFRLEEGPRALHETRERTLRALDRSTASSVVDA